MQIHAKRTVAPIPGLLSHLASRYRKAARIGPFLHLAAFADGAEVILIGLELGSSVGLARGISYLAGIIKHATPTVTTLKSGNRTTAPVESTVPYGHDMDAAPLAQVASGENLTFGTLATWQKPAETPRERTAPSVGFCH
jgi:hypothetical protein